MRECEVFKSYYVVWKRKFFHNKLEMHKWFKSYYVVWKRIQKIIAENPGISLNRTM